MLSTLLLGSSLLFSSPPAHATTVHCAAGDLNNDETINLLDLILVMNISFGMQYGLAILVSLSEPYTGPRNRE